MPKVQSNNDVIQQDNSWKSWLQNLLTVHFIITIFILVFWFYALSAPISALSDIFQKLTGSDSMEPFAQAITKITGSAVTISGIFTTVLGLVLGHYFGQKGQEAAEEARDSAMHRKELTVDDLEEGTNLAESRIDELTDSLALSNDALEQLFKILPEGTEVDEDSPVGKLLSQADEENAESSDE